MSENEPLDVGRVFTPTVDVKPVEEIKEEEKPKRRKSLSTLVTVQ